MDISSKEKNKSKQPTLHFLSHEEEEPGNAEEANVGALFLKRVAYALGLDKPITATLPASKPSETPWWKMNLEATYTCDNDIIFPYKSEPKKSDLESITRIDIPEGLTDFRHLPGEQLVNVEKIQVTPLKENVKFTLESLEGIEKFANLQTLEIYNQDTIKHLTPLSQLSNLTDLRISGSNIRDLAPLKKLKKLTYLHLSYCSSLDDVKDLIDLPLEAFSINGKNKIKDITPLFKFKKLKRLWLPKQFDFESQEYKELKKKLPKVAISW